VSRIERAVALLLLAGCPLAAEAACELSVLGMSFGDYDTFKIEDTDITTSIDVSCDVDTSYEITLSTGLGTYAARTMTSGANPLVYNLFIDPTRLSIWGDGTSGTATLSDHGTSASYSVYGRIPARQNAFVGSYSDSVIVTITF
jgi:spore coat protein U domain-containing protein, fimbrial subunit CupE1/2/3/6